MLPDPDDGPARSFEDCVRLNVSSTVGSYLLRPELCVGLGNRVMFGTAMPEASVEEHGEPEPRKDQVRRPANRPNGASAYVEAKSKGMHGPP